MANPPVILLALKASITLSVFAIGLKATIAHANFPEQRLTGGAVFLYLILSGILSALYLSWIKRQRRGRTS